MMDNPTTTIVLLVMIILAAMWKSGRLGKILNTIFASSGTAQNGTVTNTNKSGVTYTRTNPNASWSDYAVGSK